MRSIRYRPTVQVDRPVRQDHVPGNLVLKPRIVANIDLRDLLINKRPRAITLISFISYITKFDARNRGIRFLSR